jgi:hypothetical protein
LTISGKIRPFEGVDAYPHGRVVIKLSNGTIRHTNAAHLRKLENLKVEVDLPLIDQDNIPR